MSLSYTWLLSGEQFLADSFTIILTCEADKGYTNYRIGEHVSFAGTPRGLVFSPKQSTCKETFNDRYHQAIV